MTTDAEDATRDGFPPNPPTKQGYTLVFDDEFSGHELNTTRWLPYYLPQWSNRKRSAARYSLPGNRLQLHIDEDQLPWCPQHDGNVRVSSLQTGCFAGPLGTSIGQHRFKKGLVVSEEQPVCRNYTPQFGYFEVRLKAIPIPGYMVALWMIGFEETPEQSAEICICEIFGTDVMPAGARVGYGLHPFADPSIVDEFFKDVFPIDATKFHIYAGDWTPDHIDFYLDNRKTRTVKQSPHYPMQLMLNIYEIPSQLTGSSDMADWPKTLEVDYVRGFRRNAA